MNKMEDKSWVIGFIEASGCFTKNELKIARKCEKGIKIYRYSNPVLFLVNKDFSALEIARRILRVGKISKHGSSFRLEVRRKDEVLQMVNLLDNQLRSEEKKRKFEEWKKLVLQWKSRGRVAAGNINP